jgi:hypothetical protein
MANAPWCVFTNLEIPHEKEHLAGASGLLINDFITAALHEIGE